MKGMKKRRKGRRGGGVVISSNPSSTASHTNTICHRSHLESAARTGRVVLGCHGRGFCVGEGRARTHTPCSLGGGGFLICHAGSSSSSTLMVGCARQRQRGSWEDCRGGRDGRGEHHGDAVTHGCLCRLRALTAASTFSIHRGGGNNWWRWG